jgi:hypothetical protein
MKQARKVHGGVTRREREKRCGRNTAECGELSEQWTLCVGVAKRNGTLWEELGSTEQVFGSYALWRER